MEVHKIEIDSSPYQEQIFALFGLKVSLTLRYLPTPDTWEADIYDITNDKPIIYGLQLVTGTPLLERKNVPFFLWLKDLSQTNIDPTGGEDMGRRCLLYIVSKDEQTVWTQIQA